MCNKPPFTMEYSIWIGDDRYCIGRRKSGKLNYGVYIERFDGNDYRWDLSRKMRFMWAARLHVWRIQKSHERMAKTRRQNGGW